MDKAALVSARVPSEIKKQGNTILERIGATPTQLVNSAYQYVIDNEKLPSAKQEFAPAKRKLSSGQLNKIKARSLLMVLPGAEFGLESKDFKEVLTERRRASHETPA